MKRWQKIWLIILSVFAAVWGALFILTYDPDRAYFEEEYKKRIKDGVTQFPLKELTRFEWDEVCITAGVSIDEKTRYLIYIFRKDNHKQAKVFEFDHMRAQKGGCFTSSAIILNKTPGVVEVLVEENQK